MKQETRPLRRACWLLLAAAALPMAPLAAQETQPPADAPAATAQPPEAQAPPAPDEAPPAAEPAAPAAAQREAAPAPRRARVAPRTVVRVAPPAPAYVEPAPVVTSVPAAPPATVVTTPPAAVISTTTTPAPVDPSTVETLPTTPSNGVDVVPVETAPQQDNSRAIWPWLLLLGLAAVAAVLLLTRRRRGVAVVERQEVREEPLATLAPAAPLAPLAPVAPVSAARPRLALALKPRRAGVASDGPRVEFELTVDNCGDAAAEDVRVATWMLAGGASEAERALIEPAGRADTPPVTIEAGQSRTMEAAVALPSSQVGGGSILPVVVADARYRLPDGSEGHTRASYAVGVPDGETLMHFDTEQPSGLHEGVVAQPVGTPRSI